MPPSPEEAEEHGSKIEVKKKVKRLQKEKTTVDGELDDAIVVDCTTKNKRIVFSSNSSDDFVPNNANPDILKLRRPQPVIKKKTAKTSKM